MQSLDNRLYYFIYTIMFLCTFQSLRDEVIKAETQFQLQAAEKEILSFKQQQASEEIKLYLSNDPQDKKKSLR